MTTQDIRNGQKLFESGVDTSLTLNYLEHLENCKNSRVGQQVYPDKGETLRFRRLETLHPHSMICYLDFETSNQSLAEVRKSFFISDSILAWKSN